MAEIQYHQQYCNYQHQLFALQLPEIVNLILSKLDAKSLCNAACVCKQWNSLASQILRHRRQCLSYIIQSPEDIPHLDQFLQQLSIVPAAINVFCTFDKLKDTRALISCIQSNVPSNCQIIGCTSNGIIGSYETDQVPVAQEVEEAEKATILIIPRISGVTLKAFTLFKTDLKSEETVDLWKNSIEIQDLKAIFLLADYNILDSRDFTSLQAVFSNKEKPVIVGCLGQPKARLHCNFRFTRDRHREPALVALAIGGENVQVSNSLLHQSDKDELTASITNMDRPSDVSYSPSIAYMFPCVGRGYMYFGEKNVESQLIKKVFPNIHVAGCFGYGEIYNLKTKDGYNYYHSYTTALCLCWFKNDN